MNRILRVVVATSVCWPRVDHSDSLSPFRPSQWESISVSFTPPEENSCVPTSLLAAHIVVIKDVRIFQNGISQEYSDLDIMQMIGRAVSEMDINFRAR